MKFSFIYHCLDKIASASELCSPFAGEWMRVCDKCGESRPASESYCLTPIDFKPWLDECPNLSTFKAFGPNRCGDCIPDDAMSAKNYLKTPTGRRHFSEVINFGN